MRTPPLAPAALARLLSEGPPGQQYNSRSDRHARLFASLFFADFVRATRASLRDIAPREDRRLVDRTTERARTYDLVASSGRDIRLVVEVKAVMTAHVKALSRLHDEVVSSGTLARSAEPRAVVACFVLVNAAPSFLASADAKPTLHSQPAAARSVVERFATLPRERVGYDAVALVGIEMRNDGSRVEVADLPGLPQALSYAAALDDARGAYARRWGGA